MRHYCTLLDNRYLPRGLALYGSLKKHGGPFRLWVLCLDDECRDRLAKLALPEVEPISMKEFEADDADLLRAKQNRNTAEYCYTCKAPLLLFIFRKAAGVESLTYLDSDVFYFADHELAHKEIGAHSIAITPHRFLPEMADRVNVGEHNAGWMSFRRDENAMACLRWWREQCLEWCYDLCRPGRYTDQKYLDEWPKLFKNVKVLQHPGINLGPWNLGHHKLTFENGRLLVDGLPVIVYHFHAFKQLSERVFDPHLVHYRVKPVGVVVEHLYVPYWNALRHAAATAGVSWIQKPELRPWKRVEYNFRLFRNVLKRRYVMVRSGTEPVA